MMKKGIVLLITLFFISAISILILKNLDDSEQFIKEVATDTSLTQLNITVKNVQKEVLQLTTRYQENIDELLEISSEGIPFNYGNVDLIIQLEEYILKECNLNDINTTQVLYEKCPNTVEYISYIDDFMNIKKQYPKIENRYQLDHIITRYKNKTRDEKVEEIRIDGFEYLSKKDDESSIYLICHVDIDIDSIKAKNRFIFNLDSKKVLWSDTILY